MDTVEWMLLGFAALCCVPLPFLQAAERRQRRKDEARREALMAEARDYYGGMLSELKRPTKAPSNVD